MKPQLVLSIIFLVSFVAYGCGKTTTTQEKPLSFKRPERWKFLEPQDKEYSDKLKTLQAIDAFWRQFQKDEAKLSATQNHDHYGEFWLSWSKDHLRKLDQNLNYEVGTERADTIKNYLAISCDNNLALDPFVQTVLERAPKLENWNFYRHFSKYSHRRIEDAIEKNTNAKLPSFSFQIRTMPANLIGVIITAPTFHGDNVKEDKNIAWEMLELALGEKDLYTWIGAVETRKGTSKQSTYTSCLRLQKEIAQLKRLLTNRLPDKPYYELDIDEKTLSNLRTSLAARPFASERFSKHGEIFCALGSKDKNPYDSESKRETLKEELKKILLQTKLGCIIDSSLENEQSFCIDMCVTDAEKTISTLRKFCTDNKLPPNTYLFFFDETLTNEWVAMLPGADPYKSDSKKETDKNKKKT